MKTITVSILKTLIKAAINEIEQEDKEERSKKIKEHNDALEIKHAFDTALLKKLEGYANINLLDMAEIERLRKSLKVDFDIPF